jgi:long-subunit acyl-CoA synthetase (AMP-forming)
MVDSCDVCLVALGERYKPGGVNWAATTSGEPAVGQTLPTMTDQISARRVVDAASVCEHFQATVAARQDEVALRTPDDSVTLTWGQYGERVRRIAAGLAALGVRHGDTVAIMLTNRPEFHLVDAAAMHLGATPFSMYNTSSPEQVAYLFANAENRIVVCEERFLPTITAAAKDSKVEHMVCVDGGPADTMTLNEVEAAGEPGFDFDSAWRAIGPDDVLTLIYTSGTTGPPKGVELTHGNILFNIGAAFGVPEFLSGALGGRAVSYLPDAHIVNRWVAHYMAAVAGTTVTLVSNPRALISVLPKVRPTVFVAVPMLWYKLKAAIEAGISAENEPGRSVALRALELGRLKVAADTSGQSLPERIREEYLIARRSVLDDLAAKIGLDQVVLAFTGAAPIAVEALEFMLAIGVPVCEGWGMSELSAVATMNRPGAIRPGTVGTALDGVELALAEDGELLTRGAGVMKGYRNDPVKTAKAIDPDGWLHTGDIATIDDDGQVSIVDRKKELIINSAGKNMSPSNIENLVKVSCPLIGSAVAIGDRRKYVTALIALDPDATAGFAAKLGLDGASAETLAGHPAVRDFIDTGISAANEKLSRVEQVKNFTIMPTFWEPGGVELTATMKLKRKPIEEKYAAEIDALYEGAAR